MDDDPARRAARSATTRSARSSRSDRPTPKTPAELRRGGDAQPCRRRLRAATRSGAAERFWSPLTAVRTSASTSPSAGKDRIAGDPLKGTVDGAVPVRRADGRAPGHLDVYTRTPGLRRRAADHREVPGRSLGVRRRIRTGDECRATSARRDEAPRGDRRSVARRSTTTRDAGVPYVYTLEGDVEDVSRQHIANRASVIVHPAPWYIGVRRPRYFVEQKAGLKTEIVAVAPRRHGRAGRAGRRHADADPVEQRAPRRGQRLLHLGHRAQGDTGGPVDGHDRAPIRCRSHIPFADGGYFVLEARGAGRGRPLRGDAARRSTSLGDGYTAWAALRPQPHRPRARAADLQARRDGADHDPVAVGAGDGARHDRARRHPQRTGSSR